MNLYEAFTVIAKPLKLNPDELLKFAEEDRIGGFAFDANERHWPPGCIWAEEGKVLYALTRALKPHSVLEIGTFSGCSATHILEALAVNEQGYLTSVDVNGASGQDIPLSLRKRWNLVVGRGQDYIKQGTVQADLIWEDASHEVEDTVEILNAIKEHVRFKFLGSHDGAHFREGPHVQEAHRRVFGAVNVILIDPSDCGFAWTVRQNGRAK